MNVGAQPGVVGKVPADVVGVFVDHDVVAVPIPVIDVGEVKRSNAEVEAAEPEAAGIAAFEAPAVSATESAVEAAMFPGVVEVEADIVTAALVADPFAVVVDVRGFGVPFTVAEMPVSAFVMVGVMVVAVGSRRAMAGDVSATVVAVVVVTVVVVVMLGDGGEREDEGCGKNSGE